MKTKKKGSNVDYNYTARLGIISLIVLLFMVFLSDVNRNEPTPKVQAQEFISPIGKQVQEPTPTPILSQKELIIQEINQVFGVDTDKAFLLLIGKDNGSCAENRMLNTNAVNDNTQWGGIGRDCGIFQINDYFHPYTCEELKDWKLNIHYAYRMFKNDNYTFKRWVCGQEYKI